MSHFRDKVAIVTGGASMMWLYRLHPALIKPFNNAWVSTIRTHRIEQ